MRFKLILFVCLEEDELEICRGIPDGHLVAADWIDEEDVFNIPIMKERGGNAGMALARGFIKEKAGKSRRK